MLFGRRGRRPKNRGAKAGQGLPEGGHRPAQATTGARKVGRRPGGSAARSLTGARGDSPPFTFFRTRQRRQASALRPTGRRTRGREGAIAVRRRRPSGERARKHAVAFGEVSEVQILWTNDGDSDLLLFRRIPSEWRPSLWLTTRQCHHSRANIVLRKPKYISHPSSRVDTKPLVNPHGRRYVNCLELQLNDSARMSLRLAGPRASVSPPTEKEPHDATHRPGKDHIRNPVRDFLY